MVPAGMGWCELPWDPTGQSLSSSGFPAAFIAQKPTSWAVECQQPLELVPEGSAGPQVCHILGTRARVPSMTMALPSRDTSYLVSGWTRGSQRRCLPACPSTSLSPQPSTPTLTARYCGVRPPRPVRFPHVAVLSCCICWASCCCRRRCSLSFCVSANLTTMGEEQPWGQTQRKAGTGYSPARYLLRDSALHQLLGEPKSLL